MYQQSTYMQHVLAKKQLICISKTHLLCINRKRIGQLEEKNCHGGILSSFFNTNLASLSSQYTYIYMKAAHPQNNNQKTTQYCRYLLKFQISGFTLATCNIITSRRDEVAHLVRTLWANCHAHGFDAKRRRTTHSVIKCGTGCQALSPAQVKPSRVKWTAA